jgi:NAD(P)-dependent dehydrogenase (short-subunit alcohol dehydrogenase family)
MSVRGKVCVVTGASSGIGFQTALDLAAAGAKVCAAARREDRLVDLLERMGGESAGHSYVVTDVTDKAQIEALASAVRERYGRCDVLVNNAGFSNERPWHQPGAVDDLEAVMATNFYGVVRTTAAFMPLLLKSPPSSVVNVASVAGRLAIGGAPAYTASKFAVVGWSEALHFQMRAKGVFVSLVEPGIVPTEGFPSKAIVASKVLKHTTGTVEGVSKAIQDVIANRKMQRMTPRWYYLLQIPRLLTPFLYRTVQQKVVGPIYKRDQEANR